MVSNTSIDSIALSGLFKQKDFNISVNCYGVIASKYYQVQKIKWEKLHIACYVYLKNGLMNIYAYLLLLKWNNIHIVYICIYTYIIYILGYT